jgi:predicted protein tyrosine phosphatase
MRPTTFHVASRAKVASTLAQASDPIIISITDPGTQHIQFPVDEGKILRLQFHDVEDNYPAEAPHVIKFDRVFAQLISDFIFAHNNHHVVVHCEAGVCRSAGVAAALSLFLTGDCSTYFCNPDLYLPNRLVYKTLLDLLNGQDNKVPSITLTNRDG